MSFDRSKIIAEGGKYHGSDNPLIESAPFVVISSSMVALAESGNAPAYLKEDASLPKRMVIEGVFQRADVLNANRRVYPRSLWERLLDPNGSVMQRVNERAMIGHLEHPESGSTDLNKGAILITKVWMEADGTVKGRAIIYNTPEGLRLQEYIATGTKVGISSRGTGTVDARGVVCEDFALETWDMVYNPSTPGANPTATTESALTDGKSTRVIENQTDPARIDPRQSQDKPMSLSKRIAECRASVEPLLAQDPKRLTEAGRAALAGKLLDARAQVAKDFVGEDRVTEVEAVIKALAEAKAACESTDVAGAVAAPVAPEGQVPTGIPGGAMDALSKAVGGLTGDAKTKAVESMKSLSDLIAANLGKLPQIVTAVGEAITEKNNPKIDELVALLREARDEIKAVTKREEAALAMVAESAKRIKALQASVQEAKVREDVATKTIADLTAGGGKKAEDKGVTESAAPAPKLNLTERIAQAAKATGKVEDPTLPKPGAKVESAKDATSAPKKAIHEGADSNVVTDKGLVGLGAACKKIDESAPRAR